MREFPNILTVAGSDSGGGAGIQADLKTITSLKGFGLSVITALTAQNGLEVKGVLPVPPDFVLLQLQAVLEGFKIKAAKTGMLCNAEIMLALHEKLRKRDYPLVVDPVCVSQSGYKLIDGEGIAALRQKIVPLADLLTPNLPEAEELSGVKIDSPGALEQAVRKLLRLGAKAVLLKGGHFKSGEFGREEGSLTDWLCLADGSMTPLVHRLVESGNNHGTGCTTAAAIAAFLGLGCALEESVRKAQDFLLRALENSFNPGLGAGPVNFMAGAGWL
jgi:hydroxymethylpyrimidine/phosphomethylpyrimidine kinase